MLGRQRELPDAREVILLQEGERLAVGEALPAADHRAGGRAAAEASARVEVQQHRLAQAILPLDERAEAVGDGFRQHRDDGADQVARVAATLGLAVERAAGADIVRDVRDVDTHPPAAAGQLLERERIVEVLRVVRIDGEHGPFPVIEPPARVARGDLDGQGRGLAQSVVGKARLKLVGQQDRPQLRVGLVGATEAGGDNPGRGLGGISPRAEAHGHFVPGARDGLEAPAGGVRHVDLAGEARVVGRDHPATPVPAEFSDHDVAVPLQHVDDAADALAGPPSLPSGMDPHHHAVPGQRDPRIPRGDLHRGDGRRPGGLLRHREPGAAGAELNAGHEFPRA